MRVTGGIGCERESAEKRCQSREQMHGGGVALPAVQAGCTAAAGEMETRMRVWHELLCFVCVLRWVVCCWVGGEMSIRTNLWDKGLISAGRSAKTTPLLTIPRHIFKSSTRDLSLPIFGIMFLLTQYMMLTFRLSLFALHRQR